MIGQGGFIGSICILCAMAAAIVYMYASWPKEKGREGLSGRGAEAARERDFPKLIFMGRQSFQIGIGSKWDRSNQRTSSAYQTLFLPLMHCTIPSISNNIVWNLHNLVDSSSLRIEEWLEFSKESECLMYLWFWITESVFIILPCKSIINYYFHHSSIFFLGNVPYIYVYTVHVVGWLLDQEFGNLVIII